MFKKITKRLFAGISMGCTIITIILFISTLLNAQTFFQVIADDFIRQTLCSILVASSFSILSLVYDSDRLTMGLKVLLHMGGGFLVYFPIAFYANWIPTQFGIGSIITACLIMIVIAFIIWFGYYLYYYYEAKKINAKIQSNESIK